jgi:single-strand DNA-binding protein
MNFNGITGRLTKDCEVKPVGESHAIEFSIANDDETKKVGDQYENIVSFFNVVYWSKSGKMANHLKKGKAVTIEGRLKQQRWTKEDGTNQSRVIIIAKKVEPHVYESTNHDNGAPPLVPPTIEPADKFFENDNDVPF